MAMAGSAVAIPILTVQQPDDVGVGGAASPFYMGGLSSSPSEVCWGHCMRLPAQPAHAPMSS